MRRPNLIMRAAILLLVLVSLALSSTLLAQDPSPPVAKPNGPTVQLSLIVTDSKDKSLNTISKEEVRLVEDKVEQTVLSVEPDVRPVDCGIAIDASGSVRRLIESILAAAKFIIVNRQPKDEIFLERFISSDKIERLHDFSSDVNSLTAALDLLQIEGGQSAVIDAVHTAGKYVADHNRNADRRKVLVVFTDGEDRKSYYNVEKLVKLLRQERVQVFIVGLVVELDRDPRFTRPGARDRAEKLLKTIAEETGGRVFFPNDQHELVDSVTQIIHDLRGQFRITYQSSNSEKKDFRKVEVNLISPAGEKRKAIVPRGYESKF